MNIYNCYHLRNTKVIFIMDEFINKVKIMENKIIYKYGNNKR